MPPEKLLQLKMMREDASRYQVPESAFPMTFDVGWTNGYIAALKKVERMFGVLE